jgi:hypothetical protein
VTWTVDASSGKACPATNQEWVDFIAYHGLSIAAPDHIFLMQESSSSIVSVGSTKTLTVGGTAANISYQQSETGWDRKFITFANNGSGYFENANYWPASLAGSSAAILAFGRLLTAPSADRDFLLAMGDAEFARLKFDSSSRMRLIANSNNGSATSDARGSVRPYMWRLNVTGSENRAASDQDSFTVTFDAPTGDGMYLGGSAGSGAHMSCGYWCTWSGANAEISSANIKALQTALGWTPSYTP